MTDTPPFTLDFSLVAEVGIDGLAGEGELSTLASSMLGAEGATGAWEIAVALISDDELRSLHLRFMGIDEPTDIMTFPYGDDMPGGDLAISADHARARATEWGNSAQEIEFLVAHGVLHLLGWQDTMAEQRKAMLDRQEELVSRWRGVSDT